MGFFSRKKTNHPLSDHEFKEVLFFFPSIAENLYVIDEDREDGMKEYTYNFRSQHERIIGNDRYILGTIYLLAVNSLI